MKQLSDCWLFAEKAFQAMFFADNDLEDGNCQAVPVRAFTQTDSQADAINSQGMNTRISTLFESDKGYAPRNKGPKAACFAASVGLDEITQKGPDLLLQELDDLLL